MPWKIRDNKKSLSFFLTNEINVLHYQYNNKTTEVAMTTYKMIVFVDYKVSESREVEVEASSEEEAMQLAEEAARSGFGEQYGDQARYDYTFEANENSIETVEQ